MNQRKQVPWSAQRARVRAVLENREEPDFAPDPEDEDVINELMEELAEDDAERRAADIWELDDDDIDEFGNPIPVEKERKRVPWATHKAWAISVLRDARNHQ